MEVLSASSSPHTGSRQSQSPEVIGLGAGQGAPHAGMEVMREASCWKE